MIAQTIIEHRQNGGWSLAEMMDRLGSEPLFRDLILDAYERPRMATAETRQFVIEEFVNDWTLKCFNGDFVLPMQE